MKILKRLYESFSSEGYLYILLFFGIAVIYRMLFMYGLIPALLFSLIPFMLIAGGWMLQRPVSTFAFIFVLNYFIMGINRYVSIKSGIIMTVLCLGLLFTVLIKHTYQRQEWGLGKNLLVAVWFVWFIYCLLELFNPEALFEPWSISFTTIAFFPLLFAILIPVVLKRYQYVHWLLIIWGILTVLAAAKGYWQRNRGFDGAELAWLYQEGGASTHLIYTGVRYFSFFPDAANYGAGMGLSLVVFSIAGLYVKNKWMKFFFWGVALAGGYGMMISGTRSAMAVPFAGFPFFLLLCKNYRIIFFGAILLLIAYVFLNHTAIGNDNGLIRRMRTAFDFNDASFQVRQENQKEMRNYMMTKPFGVGLGLGGGKAKRFKPDSPMANIPTDSWLVMIWVETGIVGLILYIMSLVVIMVKGVQIAMYKIQNRELKGILFAFLAGISGILVCSYGNEVLSYPNGIIVFTALALIFSAEHLDKQLTDGKTA